MSRRLDGSAAEAAVTIKRIGQGRNAFSLSRIVYEPGWGESENDFQWVSGILKTLLRSLAEPAPSFFLTDSIEGSL